MRKRHPPTFDSFYSPFGPSSQCSDVVYEVRPCTSPLLGSFVILRCSNSFQMNLSNGMRSTGTPYYSNKKTATRAVFLSREDLAVILRGYSTHPCASPLCGSQRSCSLRLFKFIADLVLVLHPTRGYRGPCTRPSGRLRLFKFIPDEFVERNAFYRHALLLKQKTRKSGSFCLSGGACAVRTRDHLIKSDRLKL